jgi:mRNA-degrading endonuclease toxin of MazEF toxin-antitoxin module
MPYKRWDVVAVAFPFVEGDAAKRRPAVIVSGDSLAVDHGVYWIAMITTAKAGIRPGDLPVTDHRKVGLPEDCVIRVSRITTLSEAQIARRLGSLTARDRTAVATLLRRYLP